MPYCVQYNESDFSFISRLAKRYGEFFYYNGLQLIFGNTPRCIRCLCKK
ncbi:contractile injection system protein, VgrG/Pvc8 family [Porphyromonas gingivalis]